MSPDTRTLLQFIKQLPIWMALRPVYLYKSCSLNWGQYFSSPNPSLTQMAYFNCLEDLAWRLFHSASVSSWPLSPWLVLKMPMSNPILVYGYIILIFLLAPFKYTFCFWKTSVHLRSSGPHLVLDMQTVLPNMEAISYMWRFRPKSLKIKNSLPHSHKLHFKYLEAICG